MGLSSALRQMSTADEESSPTKEISQVFKVGEITEDDCAACSHACFPKSLKIDQEPSYNSAPKTYAQILVATSRHDWAHDITEEKEPWGQICKILGDAADNLSKVAGGKIRINGTDLDYEEDAGDVSSIVLPHFIKIQTTPENCLSDVTTVLKIKPNETLPKNMIPLTDRAYLLSCSHRTRDKRCGITAPLMKKSFDIELRDAGLYRDFDDDDAGGVRVVYCNHVGGHKFAANALIYKNNGTALMFARLRPEHARAVVQKTILNDIVFPDHTRSFNKLEAYQW